MKAVLFSLSLTVFVHNCVSAGKGHRLLTSLDKKNVHTKGDIPNAVVSATSNTHGLTGSLASSLLKHTHNESVRVVSMLSTMNIKEAKALEKSLNRNLGPKKPSLAKGTITRNIIHQLDWIKSKLYQIKSESVKKTDVFGPGAENKKQKVLEQIFETKNEILKQVKNLNGMDIDKHDAEVLEYKVLKMEEDAGDDSTTRESLEDLREAFRLLIKERPRKHFKKKVLTEHAHSRGTIGVPDRRFFAGRLGPGPVDERNAHTWSSERAGEVFTQWSAWTTCAQQCGKTSRRSRSRFCKVAQYTSPYLKCPGWQHEVEKCETTACAVDGGLTEWSEWSDCSQSCGDTSVRMRVRECTNPAPANGGKDCQGWRTQVKHCEAKKCEDPNKKQ